MKPLGEWTDGEIDGLLRTWDNYDRLAELFAELLRREREAMQERCVDAIRSRVDALAAVPFRDQRNCETTNEDAWAEECRRCINLLRDVK